MEHSKRNPLEQAAARASRRLGFVAYALEVYRATHGLDEADLAEWLGCPREHLARMGLCRRPLRERFREGVNQIATYTGADARRLAQLMREVDALQTLRDNNATRADSPQALLLAARDRMEELDVQEGLQADEKDALRSGTAPLLEASEYETATGEKLSETLDLATWQPGEDLAALYVRLEQEIAEAVQQENRIRERIRSEVFPRLRTREGAPPGAGVYQAQVEHLEKVHRGLLFTGQVEACDGTSVTHDTLPLTITQIGVCLVSYQGDQGTYLHRIYRRDLRVGGLDPVEEALEVLEKRRQRSGYDASSRRDTLSELARRGIMAYAERAVLCKKANASWLMGHGSPAPYELLTGSGMKELLKSSLVLLRELILDHQKFVFVPSAPAARMLLTVGNALRPLEYAIVDTLKESILRIADGHYRGDWAALLPEVRDFAEEAGAQVVVGVYRASDIAPAQMFYAHANYAHQAALIAMADSALQEHRGFPMMIDLADTICRTTFGAETLIAPAQLAYAEAGEPLRYLTERQSRR